MRGPAVVPWVALGGATGAVAGWLVLTAGEALLRPWLARASGTTWFFLLDALPLVPLVVVNTLGAFLLGLLWGTSRAAAADPSRRAWDPRWVPALGTGFLGSFTSISLALAWAAAVPAWLASGGLRGGLGLIGSVVEVLVHVSAGLVVLGGMIVLGTAGAAAGLRTGARR